MDYSYALRDLTVYGRQGPWEDSPRGWPQPWTGTSSGFVRTAVRSLIDRVEAGALTKRYELRAGVGGAAAENVGEIDHLMCRRRLHADRRAEVEELERDRTSRTGKRAGADA
jgi:hypothetical protein